MMIIDCAFQIMPADQKDAMGLDPQPIGEVGF